MIERLDNSRVCDANRTIMSEDSTNKVTDMVNLIAQQVLGGESGPGE